MRVRLRIPEGGIYATAQVKMLDAFVAKPGCAPDLQRQYLGALVNILNHRAVIDFAETVLVDKSAPPDLSRDAKRALARALFETGNANTARRHCEALLQNDPSDHAMQRLRANCFLRGDRPKDALKVLGALLDEDPEDAAALNLYKIAARKADTPDRAARRAEDLFNQGIRNGAVLNVFLEAGLLGNDVEVQRLADMAAGLIRFTVPKDSPLLSEADPKAIYDAVLSSPDLTDPPAHKPATNVRRLQPMDQQILTILTPVFKSAEKVINNILDGLRASEEWATYSYLFGTPPAFCQIDPWATVYDAQGHHKPHNHFSWFSGVYYPAAGNRTSGDLCLGYKNHPDADAVKRFSPQPGALVLFPSHIPHWTEQSTISENRISIAFDIYPAG